ncbi:MAG TPA: site-specific DNA-methyltransferase [Steroidobacteraceae bacterium]|nr:site-specific DNA-methyltransferase [Steroidobacteraceae bacterium]
MSEPVPHRIDRTELVWPGKYDEQGALLEPPRLNLPFQVLESFAGGAAGWRNRLIWGENLCVLASLAGELAGQVDLIYIDPPFLAGRDFTHSSGEGLRTQAYYDTWGGGRDAYLTMMWPRLLLARELLSERGSLYFHIGPNVNHYVRALLDEIFGAERGTEIIWKRTTAHSDSNAYGTVHDKILFYTRTARAIWNEQFLPHDRKYVDGKYTGRDPDGRRYMLDNITSPNPRPNMTYVWKGHAPPAMGWRYSQQKMAELDAQGRLWYPDSKAKRPRLKRYLDESRGVPLSSIWTDIRPINSQAKEDTAYDTQKPEALLERIIAASSEPGSLVLDFFCGAGTTLAVADRLGRRWIGCDLGRQAVQTSRKRMLESGARQFEILGLGSHERKYWQAATFGDCAPDTAYVGFILDLYGAQAQEGRHLHGRKGQALVRVAAIDSPVTNAQVEAALAEAAERGVQEVHILGWDWDLSVRHRADVRFLVIPREVMQSRAVERGDIRFFELAQVQLEVVASGTGVRLHLRDFVLPSVEPATGWKWSDYIDGWAVDWDFRSDPFTSRWQAYRTRHNRELKLETPAYTYAAPAVHEILVKVTDIFGNDTRHLVRWESK